MLPIPSISHAPVSALLLKFPCMATHLPHFLDLFCGTTQTASPYPPPAPALGAWSPKEEQPGGICILITATLLQTGCPGCQSRGDVAAVGDRDAADGALVPVTACLMGCGGGGAADPALRLCISGTASCIPPTASLCPRHCILRPQHCISDGLALHGSIALAAASVTGILQGSKAGTHIVLSL